MQAWDDVVSRPATGPTTTPKSRFADAGGRRIKNVYCAESRHSAQDGSVTALGAVVCDAFDARSLSEAARALKAEHGLKPDFETKWTKVSPAKIGFYLDLADLFLDDGRLNFHGVVMIGGEGFGQSQDRICEKLHLEMLNVVLRVPDRYRVFLEIRDTRGGERIRRLQGVSDDADRKHLECVQQLRSQESEPLQIARLLTGALAYANRGLSGGVGKEALVARLRSRLGPHALTRSFVSTVSGFNVSILRA